MSGNALGCGIFTAGSNVFRTGYYWDYSENVGSRLSKVSQLSALTMNQGTFSDYHWIEPSVNGTGVDGVVVVGNWHDGGYSPLYGYGPVAGLFHNLGHSVDPARGIGSRLSKNQVEVPWFPH